jgi:hypothetical protein
VIRGGSWNNNENNVRSANRNRNTPDNTRNNLGFRCARSLSRVSARAGIWLVAIHSETRPPKRARKASAGIPCHLSLREVANIQKPGSPRQSSLEPGKFTQILQSLIQTQNESLTFAY